MKRLLIALILAALLAAAGCSPQEAAEMPEGDSPSADSSPEEEAAPESSKAESSEIFDQDDAEAVPEDPESLWIANLDPTQYGGLYYSEEEDCLILLAMDVQAFLASEAMARAPVGLEVRQARYSMSQLQEAAERLWARQEELGITASAIDQMENFLMVYTNDMSEENQKRITQAAAIDNLAISEGAINTPG